MAIVIKSNKTLTSTAGFPLMSDFGIISNAEFGDFFNRLTDDGHDWTEAEFIAFNDFMESAAANAYLDKLIEVYPVFGANVTAALEPLFARLTANASLEVLTGTISSVTSGSRILGLYATDNSCLVTPLTLRQMAVKSSAFFNQGVDAVGHTFYLKKESSNCELNMGAWANDGLGYNWEDLIRQTSGVATTLQNVDVFGRAVIDGANVPWGTDEKLWLSVSNARYEFGVIDGDVGVDVTTGASLTGGDTLAALDAEDTLYADNMKYGISGYPRYQVVGGVFGLHASQVGLGGTHARIGWYSTDDGSMSEAQQTAYRNDVNTLLTALGKKF